MPGIERYNEARPAGSLVAADSSVLIGGEPPPELRLLAGHLVRLGQEVELTRVTVRQPAVRPRWATVRPVASTAPAHRTRFGAAKMAALVLATVAATGFALGAAGVGWVLVKTLAGLVVLAAVVVLVWALLAGKCPGIHCGGCRG